MKKITGLLVSLLFVSSSLAFATGDITPHIVNMTVTENGYEPSSIDVPAGANLVLKITRKTDVTCATDIVIASKKIKTALPLNKEVTVELGKMQKGEVPFSCAMDMIKGTIHVK
jgi:plastocyanin domain-containing protein